MTQVLKAGDTTFHVALRPRFSKLTETEFKPFRTLFAGQSLWGTSNGPLVVQGLDELGVRHYEFVADRDLEEIVGLIQSGD